MQIQVNTDHHVAGGEALKTKVSNVVGRAVQRFSSRVTRLEVYIADVNSGARSGPDDLRCTVEARMAGKRPISVTHNAGTVEQAVAGAAEKLQRALTRSVERQQRGA